MKVARLTGPNGINAACDGYSFSHHDIVLMVTIGSWIQQTIILHDRQHGADFGKHWNGRRYCQLIEVRSGNPCKLLMTLKATVRSYHRNPGVGLDIRSNAHHYN
jgi:hypothetical protein